MGAVGRDRGGQVDRVELPHLDVMVCWACNLKCVGCTNAMGLVPQELFPFEEIEADVKRAEKVMHANTACILGGEPLAHKDLVKLIHMVRESDLSDRVQVLTNGTRLHLMKDPFWEALDWLKISIYPGKTQPENVELAKQKSADLGFYLDFYDVASDPFRAVHRKTPASPEEAQKTYEGCWYRTYTRKIERGYLWRCCTSPSISKEILGLPPETDGIALDGLTPERVREFLDQPQHMQSCTRCFGNLGPRLGEWSEVRGDKTRWLAESVR